MGLTKQDKTSYGTAEEPIVRDYCSSLLKAFSGLQLEIGEADHLPE